MRQLKTRIKVVEECKDGVTTRRYYPQYLWMGLFWCDYNTRQWHYYHLKRGSTTFTSYSEEMAKQFLSEKHDEWEKKLRNKNSKYHKSVWFFEYPEED